MSADPATWNAAPVTLAPRRRLSDRARLLLLGFGMLAFGVTFLFAAPLQARREQAAQHGPSADALVIGQLQSSRGVDQVRVAFVTAGGAFGEAVTPVAGIRYFPLGTITTIHYNPADPSDVMATRHSGSRVPAPTILGGILALSGVAFLGVAARVGARAARAGAPFAAPTPLAPTHLAPSPLAPTPSTPNPSRSRGLLALRIAGLVASMAGLVFGTLVAPSLAARQHRCGAPPAPLPASSADESSSAVPALPATLSRPLPMVGSAFLRASDVNQLDDRVFAYPLSTRDVVGGVQRSWRDDQLAITLVALRFTSPTAARTFDAARHVRECFQPQSMPLPGVSARLGGDHAELDSVAGRVVRLAFVVSRSGGPLDPTLVRALAPAVLAPTSRAL